MLEFQQGTDSQSETHSTQIDLALSGGGFRASLFHLGVVGFLHEHDLLRRVRNICSVSGGSVFAAYLVAHWSDFNSKERFRDRACEFAKWIMEHDVSGEVLRNSKLRVAQLKPLNSELLAAQYDKLLLVDEGNRPALPKDLPDVADANNEPQPVDGRRRPLRWKDLPDAADPNSPQLHILATHLNTGRPCSFSRKTGFSIERVSDSHRYAKQINGVIDAANNLDIGSESVSRAVAASSAFPPVFSPISPMLDDKVNRLIDGGVYDNSGAKHLQDIHRRERGSTSSERLIILSDAGRAFPIEIDESYDGIVALALRVINTQSDRIARSDYKSVIEEFASYGFSVLSISILDRISAPLVTPNTHGDRVQLLLGRLRTELDKFSAEEVFALYRHGYLATQKQYETTQQQTERIASLNAPIDWTPANESDVRPHRMSEPLLEGTLETGRKVKKWEAIFGYVLRVVIALVTIISATLCGGGFILGLSWGTPPSLPDGNVTEIAGRLPPGGERKAFVENAVVKAHFHSPIAVPVSHIATIFYECEKPTPVNMQIGSTQRSPGKSIKLQVLLPEVATETKVVIRPRTTPSSGGVSTKTFVYSVNPNTSPEPVLEDKASDTGYAEFEAQVRPNGAIAIVSHYYQSYFSNATADFPTGWIHVEVSDYVNRMKPEYWFAVGSFRHMNLRYSPFEVEQGHNAPYLPQHSSTHPKSEWNQLKDWPHRCRESLEGVLNSQVKNPGSQDFIEGLNQLQACLKGEGPGDCFGHHLPSASHDMAYILQFRDLAP